MTSTGEGSPIATSKSFRLLLVVAGAVALSLSMSAVGSGAKSKKPRLGTSTEIETSTKAGPKKLVVTGVLQSAVPRCERQRSVLLYEAGPNGDLVGGAIAHAVTSGGALRGQFTLKGKTVKRISATRRFVVEAVGREVKINGKEETCKRGVSAGFLSDFNPNG